MKKHATTIVIFVLVAILGAWVWLDRDKVTTSEAKLREKNVFPVWRKDDLSRIAIAHDDETFALERHGGSWELLAPRVERVDGAAVDRLLGVLEFATRVRPADGELGAERAHGEIAMGDLRVRFVLGAPAPKGDGSSYVRVDDGAPFVVSKELTDALLAPSDTYRDRTVVPYLATELRRFEVEGHFALDRADDRSFLVGGTLAARATVEKIWNALAEVRAESFAKRPEPERKLVLHLVPKDSTRPDAELVFGEACPGHPADVVVVRTKPSPVEACVPRVTVDVLSALTPADLVERHPFTFHHDEIEELRLEPVGAGRAIELARRGTGFHLREPEDRELDGGEADAVGELLRLVEASVADTVPTHEPFAAPVARAKVRVGPYEETVEVGAIDAHGAKLHRLRDDVVLHVAPAVARRLLPRATVLRPLALFRTPPAVTRIALRCGTAQDFVDEGQGLRLVAPAGYATDGAITQLVDGITKGKAVAWVADADDGSFGLDGACRVTLGDVTVTFGAETDGGFHARIDNDGAVFVAPPSLHALARRIFVSHALLPPGPVTAVVRNGQPTSAPDPGATLVADDVETLASSDVGRVDLTLEIAQRASTTRIVCGPVGEHWRRCAVAGTKAVFSVHPEAFAALLGVPDAGGGDASIDHGRRRP